jgi:hypothetical protein
MAVLLVAHAPDGLVAVFADKQAAIFRDRDSDRATPDDDQWVAALLNDPSPEPSTNPARFTACV